MTEVVETQTFCRICEALCGMAATVEDGRVAKMRPDPDHPVSQGFACPKGVQMPEVVNDPDRLLFPLRRKPGVAPGPAEPEQFERVSWEDAYIYVGMSTAPSDAFRRST